MWEDGTVEKIVDAENYEIYSIKVNTPFQQWILLQGEGPLGHRRRKGEEVWLEGKQLRTIKEREDKGRKQTILLEQIAKKKEGRKVVYSGDTVPCEQLFEMARGADLLIHDSTFVEMPDVDRPHASAVEVAKLAKKYKVKKLVLTHLSRRYKTSKEVLDAVKPIFDNVVVAEDLMGITLK
jgi:ribonuclease Z